MNETITLAMQTTDVLLVENSQHDARVLRDAISWCGQSRSSIHIAIGGLQALQFLRSEGGYSARSRPGLIVVNKNLRTNLSTAQLMSALRRDRQLSAIPLFVLAHRGAAHSPPSRSAPGPPLTTRQLSHAASAIHNLWLNTPAPVSDSADRMDGVA